MLMILGSAIKTSSSLAQAADASKLASAVKNTVNSAVQAGRIAGVSIAVVRGQDTLLNQAYGKADLELDVPMPDRAVYEIGSMTKQFTAAAILHLSEAGKLALDDEIGDYLPRYSKALRGVTLRRLLDHTAGMVSLGVARADFRATMRLPAPKDSIAQAYGALPLEFAPGTSIAYSNTGYFFLGLVIEAISGKPYATYLADEFFTPLGMRDTHYCSGSAIVPRRAHGYTSAADGLRRAEFFEYDAWFAAGALCSTSSDLLRWSAALHGGKVLGRDAYRELITPGRLTDGTPLRYAKGLRVSDIAGHRAIHHGGTLAGSASEMAYLPDDSLTVVVLMNTMSSALRPAAILENVVRGVVGVRPLKAAAAPAPAAEYVGEYRTMRDGKPLVLTIATDSVGVTIRSGSSRAVPLTYLGADTFGRDGDNTRWIFVREAGRVVRLRVDDISATSTAERVAGM